jgi:hypothetical protein
MFNQMLIAKPRRELYRRDGGYYLSPAFSIEGGGEGEELARLGIDPPYIRKE